MTIDKAINVLKEHVDTYITCHREEDTVAVSLDNVDIEALDMAIKALQQTCEDVISRKDIYFKLTNGAYPNESIEQFIDRLVKELEALPPVQPKPKTGHWIPVKFRPLTNEEQEEYPNYCYMADCPMPDDGEEILVSTKNGRVEKDECGFDDGYYLDSGYDWQTDIVAWMPLPESYKPQKSEE